MASTFEERVRPFLEPDPRPVPSPGDRLAAVLVAVLVEEGDTLVLTERQASLSRHPGQVAFPGGLVQGRETPAEAALRETEEEIDLPRTAVRLLGALPPVHTVVSGILVVPFVGVVRGRPVFRPDPVEIAAIFEAQITRLDEIEREEEWERGGRRLRTYVYEVEGRTVWGATAAIVRSLLEILRGAP